MSEFDWIETERAARKPVAVEIDRYSLTAIIDAVHCANRFHEDGGFILWAHDLTSGISQRVILKPKQ